MYATLNFARGFATSYNVTIELRESGGENRVVFFKCVATNDYRGLYRVLYGVLPFACTRARVPTPQCILSYIKRNAIAIFIASRERGEIHNCVNVFNVGPSFFGYFG